MELLFWISTIAVFYTYFGYPACAVILARIRPREVHKDYSYAPSVSVLLPLYNEKRNAAEKIKNLLESDYPAGGMEVLVGSDGSTDGTNDIISGIKDDRVRAFIFPVHRGKVSVLNDLTVKAAGEILVFCDARQSFDRMAIRRLAANFADPEVGCVSGGLIYKKTAGDNGVVEGASAYWEYEKMIRRAESLAGSTVVTTGAIYAIRKELYSPPPADIIVDDMYIPLSAVRKGYRCVFDEEAKAFDDPLQSPEEEYNRRVKALAGNYQIFGAFKDLFIPFRSPVAIPLFSHKFMRVAAPFFIISAFISNLTLAKKGVYSAALAGQVVFYILALLGSAACRRGNNSLLFRTASTIYMFCVMNSAALKAFFLVILRKGMVI